MDNLIGNESLQGSLSIIDLVLESEPVVKVVIFALIVCSVISWKVIFSRSLVIYRQLGMIEGFEREIRSGGNMNCLYDKAKNEKNSLMAKIFISGFGALKSINYDYSAEEKRNKISCAMRVELNKSLWHLEKDISFLASVGSSAPFVGLFGTVWGIMASFQAITISKSTSLAVVAPSIAEALLTTAIGLIVAIPATIAYNKFVSSIDGFCNRAENFIHEFILQIDRESR